MNSRGRRLLAPSLWLALFCGFSATVFAGAAQPAKPGGPGEAAGPAGPRILLPGAPFKTPGDEMKAILKILVVDLPIQPAKPERDPLTYAEPYVAKPTSPAPPSESELPGTPTPVSSATPGVVRPTQPPQPGAIDIQPNLQRIETAYARAEVEFLRGDYAAAGSRCDEAMVEIDTVRVLDPIRIRPEQQGLRNQADDYAVHASRLKRTADRLKLRLEAEREFAGLNINFQSVIWSPNGPSWAVIQEQVFDEDAILGRTPVPGLTQRVYVNEIQPHAVVFLFSYQENLYQIRREIGAEKGETSAGGAAAPPRRTGPAQPARTPAKPPAKPPAKAPASGGGSATMRTFFK